MKMNGMKNKITAIALLATAISAQAVVIDFTNNAEYPVGDNLWSHSDWSGAALGAGSSALGSENGIVVGNQGDNDWDSYRYSGESFDTAVVGSTLTSSIDFSFFITGGNGWTEMTKTGFRSGSTDMIAYFSRAGNGTGPTSEFSLEFGGGQTIFYGSDFGITGLNQASSALTLTYSITKTATDTWDGIATIAGGGFTTNRTVTGLTWADNGTAIGTWGNGRPSNDAISSYTVSEFVAIPEPATLSLVIGFGGAVLVIRRRFMM